MTDLQHFLSWISRRSNPHQLHHFCFAKMVNEAARLLFTRRQPLFTQNQRFSSHLHQFLKPCLWRRSLCSLVKPLISFACEVFPLSRVMMVLFCFFIRDDSSKVIHFWNHQKHLLHLQTLVIGSILRSDNKNRFLYGNSENILLYSIILFGGVLAL